MRIISQDNETNVPYEVVAIGIEPSYAENYEIVAGDRLSDPDAAWTVLGEYSSYDKALGIFEQIIMSGNAGRKTFRMPLNKDVPE